MGDLDRKDESTAIQITNRDENLFCDLVNEDGVTKLLVKATTVPDTTSRLVFAKFTDGGGSSDMAVNGSSTPVVFSISADPTLDAIVREIKFTSFDSGIRVDRFLGLNSALTNGIQVTITTGGISQDFIPILTTQDFDGHFAYGDGARFQLISSSGNDSLIAQFSPREPIVLEAGTADNITITIQDNLNQVAFLEAVAFGLFDV